VPKRTEERRPARNAQNIRLSYQGAYLPFSDLLPVVPTCHSIKSQCTGMGHGHFIRKGIAWLMNLRKYLSGLPGPGALGGGAPEGGGGGGGGAGAAGCVHKNLRAKTKE